MLKSHVIHSFNFIKDNDLVSEKVKKGVLFHHERFDGSGYPRGIKGDDIPLYSKIIAVADIYNALTSIRAHRPKMTPFQAIKILEEEHRDKLDPKVLYVFLNKIGSAYVGIK